jgi:hypothetical protein
MKPDAWIQWTAFGNKMLAFKKPDASLPCYTGIDVKERTEPLGGRSADYCSVRARAET